MGEKCDISQCNDCWMMVTQYRSLRFVSFLVLTMRKGHSTTCTEQCFDTFSHYPGLLKHSHPLSIWSPGPEQIGNILHLFPSSVYIQYCLSLVKIPFGMLGYDFNKGRWLDITASRSMRSSDVMVIGRSLMMGFWCLRFVRIFFTVFHIHHCGGMWKVG